MCERDSAAAPPDQHQTQCRSPDDEREPAAVRDLVQIGRKKGHIEREEQACHRQQQVQRPAPHATRNGGDEHRRDQHVAGDCYAIGVGERIRAAEPEHQAEHRRDQQPIDLWHVDLSGRLFRGLPHLKARHRAELNCLLHNA